MGYVRYHQGILFFQPYQPCKTRRIFHILSWRTRIPPKKSQSVPPGLRSSTNLDFFSGGVRLPLISRNTLQNFVGVRSLEIIIQYHPCMCHFFGGNWYFTVQSSYWGYHGTLQHKIWVPKKYAVVLSYSIEHTGVHNPKTKNIEHKIWYTCIGIYDILAFSNWATLLGYKYPDCSYC